MKIRGPHEKREHKKRKTKKKKEKKKKNKRKKVYYAYFSMYTYFARKKIVDSNV